MYHVDVTNTGDSKFRAASANGEFTIDTKGGFLVAEKAGDALVTIDNGAPRFDWKDIPLSEKFHDTRHIELQVGPVEAPLIHSPSVVNVGNPHCIFWVKDLDV